MRGEEGEKRERWEEKRSRSEEAEKREMESLEIEPILEGGGSGRKVRVI